MDVPAILDWDVFDLADRILDAYPEPIPFDDFASYHLLKPIGRGGMGEVFLAEDRAAGRRVAIKFLRNLWSDPDLQHHFSREIHMLAQLEHPYIARLYELGVHPNGTPFFVMEYVEGRPLDQYLSERECSLEERMQLFRSVCEAVRYAHSRAVIHLDLKPSNILVKDDGTPVLLDFGIAKHLENLDEPVNQTQLRCTPAFAAPEQIRRQPVGIYTDVYALGIVLYELLARKHPHNLEGCTPGEVEAIITGDREPAKPSASVNRVEAGKAAWNDLDVLCLKAIKKDVPSRYHSAVELIQDIDHFLRGEPLKARRDSLVYRASKFLLRNRRAVLASAAAVVMITGLIVFYTVRLATARDAALQQAIREQRIQKFTMSIFGGDYNSAPSGDLRVVDMLDRGVQQAGMLNRDPAVQGDLYQTLGSLYESLGKLDRADRLLKSGLEKRTAAFGSDSPEISDSLVALSVLRIDQARYADSERLARRAIAIDERHLPSDDPKLGNALSTLGSALEHRGEYAEAISATNRAIRIQSKSPALAADLAESLTYLANTELYLGHDTIAESLDRRILALDRKIYGDRHPSVSEDLANLGQIQEQMGLYADAERNERESMEITEAWYGRKDHIEVALDAEGLAGTLICEHKYDEAAPLAQLALKTDERDFGKNHPFVALALNQLGVVALKHGDLNAAEADFNRMDAIYRSAFPEKNKHVALGLSRFGELYEARNDYPRAEQFFRKSVQIFSEALSADNVQTGSARIKLGGVLAREHRYKEAEAELLAGYRIVTPGRSPSLDAAIEAREDLAAVYEALGAPHKAARFGSEGADETSSR